MMVGRDRMVLIVRWLLGVQCLLSGLNWWFGFLPFPHVFDPPGMPMKSAIVGAMISSGWMFTLAKVIEVATGVALIFNRHAVVMLVVAFPILLMTFLIDAIPFFGMLARTVPHTSLWHGFLDMVYFGGGVFLMQGYLMLVWFQHYRPMFARRPGEDAPLDLANRWLEPALAWPALVIGGSSTVWIFGMVCQWAIPWASLAILAQPK